MTDEQQAAIAALERELRLTAKNATALADIVSGKLESTSGPVNVTDRPDRPATSARFADLVELDIRLAAKSIEKALATFRSAFAPSPLRLVEPEGEPMAESSARQE